MRGRGLRSEIKVEQMSDTVQKNSMFLQALWGWYISNRKCSIVFIFYYSYLVSYSKSFLYHFSRFFVPLHPSFQFCYYDKASADRSIYSYKFYIKMTFNSHLMYMCITAFEKILCKPRKMI